MDKTYTLYQSIGGALCERAAVAALEHYPDYITMLIGFARAKHSGVFCYVVDNVSNTTIMSSHEKVA